MYTDSIAQIFCHHVELYACTMFLPTRLYHATIGTTILEQRWGANGSERPEVGTCWRSGSSISSCTGDERSTKEKKFWGRTVGANGLFSKDQCIKFTSSPLVYRIWSLYCASGGSDWTGALVAWDSSLHRIRPPPIYTSSVVSLRFVSCFYIIFY